MIDVTIPNDAGCDLTLYDLRLFIRDIEKAYKERIEQLEDRVEELEDENTNLKYEMGRIE